MKITIQITGHDREKLHIEANAIIEHMQKRGYTWVSGGKNVVTSKGSEGYMVIKFKQNTETTGR